MVAATSLTQTQRDIAQIRDLPVHRRMAAARALIPQVDEAIAGVDEETAAGMWLRLAQHGTGRRVDIASGQRTPDVVRAVAVEALQPGDRIAAVREARAAHEEALRAVERTGEAFRRAVGDGRRAGETVEALMSAAGVARQTVYDWTSATASAG